MIAYLGILAAVGQRHLVILPLKMELLRRISSLKAFVVLGHLGLEV